MTTGMANVNSMANSPEENQEAMNDAHNKTLDEGEDDLPQVEIVNVAPRASEPTRKNEEVEAPPLDGQLKVPLIAPADKKDSRAGSPDNQSSYDRYLKKGASPTVRN